MEYQKTKDILYVKQLLGHKSIKNTLLYTQLVNFREGDDEFICKVAKSPNEVQELIENEFEYVCDMDDLKFSGRGTEVSLVYSKSPLKCRGPGLNRRQPGLQLRPHMKP